MPVEKVNADVGAAFSQIVDAIKHTSANESKLAVRRPSRPHHITSPDQPDLKTSPTVTGANNSPAEYERTASARDLPMNRCMFCNYDSPTFKLNVMHMSRFHGMFIPEQPYLVDLEGLIRYLYGKIAQLYECLYCHKLKSSVQGIQTHMRDKGHCMIAFESEEEMIEVGQFYDFSGTYSDDGDSSEDADYMSATTFKHGSKELKALKTVISGSNGDEELRDGEENAEGWETDSSASSLDSENLSAVPIDHDHAYERLPLHRHHSHVDPRPHRAVDGFHSHAHNHFAVFRSDYELHLPSGRTAGHRSLWRYYRQNLHNYPTAAERTQSLLVQDASSNRHGRLMATRAEGEMGMVGVADSRKREARAAEKREQKREERGRQHYQWGLDKRGNAQKHFRDPLLQ